MIAVGTTVTSRYRGEHQGVVLAKDDPRVWAGSLAFPEESPDPEKVRAHVEKCLAKGLLTDATPVLWDFGRVYWDRDLTPVVRSSVLEIMEQEKAAGALPAKAKKGRR